MELKSQIPMQLSIGLYYNIPQNVAKAFGDLTELFGVSRHRRKRNVAKAPEGQPERTECRRALWVLSLRTTQSGYFGFRMTFILDPYGFLELR